MSVVVAQPYSIEGNGGRKLVRLSNGWLVATAYDTVNTCLMAYVSKDNGDTWNNAFLLPSILNHAQKWSIVPMGNNLGVLYSYATSMYIRFRVYSENGTMITNSQLSNTEGDNTGGVSIFIDPVNGHLHAAWTSKNATYPNSFNIRYSKSEDGGATFSSPEQVTMQNTLGRDAKNPSIIVDANGIPNVIFEAIGFRSTSANSNFRAIIQVKRDLSLPGSNLIGSGWSATNVYLDPSWTTVAYSQSSPSAVVDKDGVLVNVWHGRDSTHTTVDYIRFSKSIDGGVNWVAMQKLVTGKNASFSTDKNNKYIISYEDGGVIKQITSTNKGDSWSSPVNIGTGTNPNSLYDNTFIVQFGAIQPTVYQTSTSVEYIGTYTANTAPTLTLKDSLNQPITQNQSIKHTNKTPFLFKILAQDSDVGDTLQYQIMLRNVEYKTWTSITSGVETEISIPYADMLTGNNNIEVKVRDSQLAETSSLFVLRNLTPESYSQKHVYDLIVGYM